MNEQISLAYSIQPDGSSSYALSIIPQTDGAPPIAINLASAGVQTGSPDETFIAAINSALAAYRTSKGI
jgi:hypothetical protein